MNIHVHKRPRFCTTKQYICLIRILIQCPNLSPNRPTHPSKLPRCSLRKTKVRYVAQPAISRVPYIIYARVEKCFMPENWQETGAYRHRNAIHSINLIILAKNGRILDASVIHCRIDLLTYWFTVAWRYSFYLTKKYQYKDACKHICFDVIRFTFLSYDIQNVLQG